MENKKVGLLTYHSAYNFGSMLQAYATQTNISNLGYLCEIINYRMKSQKDFYKFYRTKYGFRTFAYDLWMIPSHLKRNKRKKSFESFLKENMKTTREVETPEEAIDLYKNYDILVSGSDQILNKHSCELQNNDWKYMKPYLLDGFSGKKISYASSVANMNEEELNKIKNYLKDFSSFSVREDSSVNKMEKLIDKEIQAVLDPTFLLNKEEWIESLSLKKSEEKFILFYYLGGGIKDRKRLKRELIEIADKYSCKVKVVTPFIDYYFNDKRIENHPEYGPKEFLENLYNAELVITNSYHGTILAINMNRNFISICGKSGSEYRKTDVLKKLNLTDNIVPDVFSITNVSGNVEDYDKVNNILNEYREKSKEYLKKSLEQ